MLAYKRGSLATLVALVSIIELALIHGCGSGGIGGRETGSTSSGGLQSSSPPLLALTVSPPALIESAAQGASAILSAHVVDTGTHLPMAGVPVSFFASSGSLSHPTAITDSNGTAVDLLNEPSGTQELSAEVTVRTRGISASASIPIGNLAAINLSTSPSLLTCPQNGAALGVVSALALDQNNKPIAGVTIAFAAGGGSINPLSTTDSNGTASATVSVPSGYPNDNIVINAGAAGVKASIAIPVSACASQSPNPTPTAGNGQPTALQFQSAQPAQLGVLQSGQPQQSVVTFKLTDSQSAPVPDVEVDFFISSVGGEAISPRSAKTAVDGTVQTVLTSGTRATVVQITAEAGSIVAVSSPVTIVGGLPMQGRISASPQFQNIAGNVTAGLVDPISVLMSDRFSNPVAPGTAVSLQSVGGAVRAPSPSDSNGSAAGALISESPTNPSDLDGNPTGGIVTVLAFTHGETPFIDSNGNGVYDPGETVIAVPEPFFDLNGNGVRDANEPYIDLNGNQSYDQDQSGGRFSQRVVVFSSTRVSFSGASAVKVAPPSGFTIPNGGSQSFVLSLTDTFGNPLVGGSTYQITSAPAGTVQGASGTIPDGQSFGQTLAGLNQFAFTVTDSDDANTPRPITITVTLTSPPSANAPGGNGSTSLQINGTMN